MKLLTAILLLALSLAGACHGDPIAIALALAEAEQARTIAAQQEPQVSFDRAADLLIDAVQSARREQLRLLKRLVEIADAETVADYGTDEEAAWKDRRPLIVVFELLDNCPGCRQLDRSLQDKQVRKDLAGFALVRITCPSERAVAYRVGAPYPQIRVLDADRVVMFRAPLPGRPEPWVVSAAAKAWRKRLANAPH